MILAGFILLALFGRSEFCTVKNVTYLSNLPLSIPGVNSYHSSRMTTLGTCTCMCTPLESCDGVFYNPISMECLFILYGKDDADNLVTLVLGEEGYLIGK